MPRLVEPIQYRKHSIISLYRPSIIGGGFEGQIHSHNTRKNTGLILGSNQPTDLYRQSFLGRTNYQINGITSGGTNFPQHQSQSKDDTGSVHSQSISVRSRAIQKNNLTVSSNEDNTSCLVPGKHLLDDIFNRRNSQRSMSLISQVVIKPTELAQVDPM